MDAVADAFHAAHREAYGHTPPIEEIDVVTLRAHALVPARRHGDTAAAADATEPSAATTRDVWSAGAGRRPQPVLARAALEAAEPREGPLLVEQPDSTIVVAAGWRIGPAPAGAAILERIS